MLSPDDVDLRRAFVHQWLKNGETGVQLMQMTAQIACWELFSWSSILHLGMMLNLPRTSAPSHPRRCFFF